MNIKLFTCYCFVELRELAKEGLQKFKSINFLSMTSGTGTPLEMVIIMFRDSFLIQDC